MAASASSLYAPSCHAIHTWYGIAVQVQQYEILYKAYENSFSLLSKKKIQANVNADWRKLKEDSFKNESELCRLVQERASDLNTNSAVVKSQNILNLFSSLKQINAVEKRKRECK